MLHHEIDHGTDWHDEPYLSVANLTIALSNYNA